MIDCQGDVPTARAFFSVTAVGPDDFVLFGGRFQRDSSSAGISSKGKSTALSNDVYHFDTSSVPCFPPFPYVRECGPSFGLSSATSHPGHSFPFLTFFFVYPDWSCCLCRCQTGRCCWKRIPVQGDVIPPPLEGSSLNFVGEYLYLFGGFDGRAFSNQSFVLDLGLLSCLFLAGSGQACMLIPVWWVLSPPDPQQRLSLGRH